jgi:hypothetical protein
LRSIDEAGASALNCADTITTVDCNGSGRMQACVTQIVCTLILRAYSLRFQNKHRCRQPLRNIPLVEIDPLRLAAILEFVSTERVFAVKAAWTLDP